MDEQLIEYGRIKVMIKTKYPVLTDTYDRYALKMLNGQKKEEDLKSWTKRTGSD